MFTGFRMKSPGLEGFGLWVEMLGPARLRCEAFELKGFRVEGVRVEGL